MSMKSTNTVQWYNENEGRSYPIGEDATHKSDAGALLPDDIIVDMGLLVEAAHTDVYLSSVRVTPDMITVGISSSVSGLMVGTFIRSDVQPYVAYPLTGVVDNVSGWIVFGSHVAVTTETYRFSTAAQSRLEGRVVRTVDALPVAGLMKFAGDPLSKLSGIVRLQGAGGVTFTSPGPGQITVNLDTNVGVGLISPCNKPATRSACKNTPFKTINGVGGTTVGAAHCAFPGLIGGVITLRFE